MVVILWPAVLGWRTQFLAAENAAVAARRLQRVGTLTTVWSTACYFFSTIFPTIFLIFVEFFVAALCTYRCRRSPVSLHKFWQANSLANKKGLVW